MSATVLLYINAAFGLLFGELWWTLYGVPVGAVLVLGQGAAGLGIANEKKWGYWLGVALTGAWVAYLLNHFYFGAIISLMIYVAMLGLLLHPMSRSYRKTWFR
jgi:hypothetical protein